MILNHLGSKCISAEVKMNCMNDESAPYRISAEMNHIGAETNRISAETAHIGAESNSTGAETNHISAGLHQGIVLILNRIKAVLNELVSVLNPIILLLLNQTDAELSRMGSVENR